MKEVVEAIKGLVEKKKVGEDIPLIKKEGLKPIKISKDNFHLIKKTSNGKTLCFIDGGNAEIIGANNFSLQFIRIASVLYKYNKKIDFEKKEFHVLIKFEDEKIKARIIPSNETFEFSLKDESLKEGRSISKISKIGNFIRRLKELELAKEVSLKNDIIVLDGSLEEKFTYEKKYLKELYASGKIICAVSKTNSMITNNGEPISSMLNALGKGQWYYHPIALIDNDEFLADIYFVKLHEKSQHVFKIDVHRGDIKELFSCLKENSKDPVFFGYPYGLIEADRIARVSNKEREYLQTRLMTEMGQDWKKIKKLMNTTNAHEILDSIS